jgi:ribosomal protein L7/L12
VIVREFDPAWKIRGIKAIREVSGKGIADAKGRLTSAATDAEGGVQLTI